MSLKQKMYLVWLVAAAGTILILLFIWLELGKVLLLGGIVLVFSSVFLGFHWKRCPYCDGYLGRDGLPKFCPNCGKAIDPDAKEKPWGGAEEETPQSKK